MDSAITVVHFSKFFLRYLRIKIPNEELILHNDCCKSKKSSSEKCHFQDAVWDFFNFGLCNFFLVQVR